MACSISPIEAYILVHLHTSLVDPLNRAPWLAPLHGETIEEATTAKVVIENCHAGKLIIHPLFRSALGLNADPDPAFYLKADPIMIQMHGTKSRRIYADSADPGQA